VIMVYAVVGRGVALVHNALDCLVSFEELALSFTLNLQRLDVLPARLRIGQHPCQRRPLLLDIVLHALEATEKLWASTSRVSLGRFPN
jgi:hypothetical protein